MGLMDSDPTLWWEPPAALAELTLVSAAGTEGLSEPFRYELLLREPTDQCRIPFDDARAKACIGQPLAFGLTAQPGFLVHGVVDEASGRAGFNSPGEVRLVVVPRFARLARGSRSRLFQNRTLEQILEQVLAPAGVAFDLALTGPTRPRPFVLQHRESDAGFLTRLMRAEGVGYWFHHTRAGHVMVVTDDPARVSGPPRPVLLPPPRAGGGDPPAGFWHWEVRRTARGVRVDSPIYNPEAPDASATVGEQTPQSIPDVVVEGEVVTSTSRAEAEKHVTMRREELEAGCVGLEASGDVALRAAEQFTLGEGGPAYLVRGVYHAAQNAVFGREAFVTARIEAQPLGLRYRPARDGGRRPIDPLPAVVVYGDGRSRPRGVVHPRFGAVDEVFVRFPFAKEAVPARVAAFWSGTRGLPCVGDHVRVDVQGDRPLVICDLPGRPRRGGKAKLSAGGRRIVSPEDLLLEVAKILRFDVQGDTVAQLLGRLVFAVAGECVFDVKKKITIRCGESTIVLAPDGISITSTKLYLNSPGGPEASPADES